MTRIVAELVASAVPVVAVVCALDEPGCPSSSVGNVAATMLISPGRDVSAVEIRAGAVDDPGAHRWIKGDGNQATLAIRAVEELHAMLVVASADSSQEDGASAQRPQFQDNESPGRPRFAWPPPVFVRRRWTLSGGASALTSFSGLGTAVGPSVAVSRRVDTVGLLTLSFIGPTFEPERTSAAGRVSLSQEVLLFHAAIAGRSSDRWIPFLGLGFGGYHVEIEGHGNAMLPGQTVGTYAVVAAASTGLTRRLMNAMGLFVNAEAFLLVPAPVVGANGTEVGRAGRPSLLVSAGVDYDAW